MKKKFLYIIQKLLSINSFRKLILILSCEKNKYEAKLICNAISPDNIVLRGPFKGMKYPSLNSAGSALLPKILGSYEDELHPLIFSIINNKYTEIIDVGCAEGYYAVGFAMNFNNCKVYAFDTDKSAIKLCEEMAEKNNVRNKIAFGNFCSPETLQNFSFSGKGLIFSDCEGYETTLFNNNNIQNLTNCDILIELHTLIIPDAQQYFEKLFSQSHEIQIIESKLKHVDDYAELKSIAQKFYDDAILLERNTRMKWMFLKSKK